MAALARGEHSFLDVLKEAKAPLVLVGAHAEPGVLAAAASLAKSIGAISAEWNGFGVLHTAARFASLGDRESTDQCLLIAEGMAETANDTGARDRVRRLAARMMSA